MGRTAAWIKLPDFGGAIREIKKKGVDLKIVVFFEGDAHKHAQTWKELGTDVRFFEHGFIRLLIFDDSDAIIAFPKVVTSLYEDREYFGYHISDERSVSELRNYFNQIWEQADSLPDQNLETEPNQVEVRTKFAAGVMRFIIKVIAVRLTLQKIS